MDAYAIYDGRYNYNPDEALMVEYIGLRMSDDEALKGVRKGWIGVCCVLVNLTTDEIVCNLTTHDIDCVLPTKNE